jgi:FtsP/CotA-like multicopper oxidase with cupredoxin domain
MAFPGTEPIAAANGDRVLLRFANAGSQTYNPTINGLNMLCIAEDGYPLTYPQTLHTLTIPSGKTKDVIVTPSNNAGYALYDHRYNLSNAGAPGAGGMQTYLVAGVLPTTTVIFRSVAADDGWLRESAENSNVGGASNATDAGPRALRVGDEFIVSANEERQYKSILSFDTSAIPDGAIIQSALLVMRRSGLVGTNPFDTHGACLVDIASGSFGLPALENSDFQAAATATGVATMSNPPANGALSSGNLNVAGLTAIDKTGLTQLRVYFATGNNDDNATNAVGFFSGDNASYQNRPMLRVIYTAP